ncbi:MAG: response regulator transcription factor [Cyanobacteria bacterium CAN_BIN43]|nr:response regulator transcription factor [Cyanobacteria bacterium CAN_BIN43]
MRILIVEDDVQIADMLAEALGNHQYVVDIAKDGEMAWNWIEICEYDLILLDVTLPKINGIRLCQKLRDRRSTVSILMLTARDTLEDKVVGLDAGADVYMVKPFDLEELMAQIRALLRRGSAGLPTILQWEGLSLNHSTYEVLYQEQPLSLTRKEFTLLELLVTSGRRVLSRPGIIDRMWSLDDAPTEDAVKAHIRTLRQKLKVAGAPEDLIETVHGLGYRMKQS